MGPAGERARGVPPAPLDLVARVVAIAADLLLGSKVEAMLGAAGHEVTLSPALTQAPTDDADLLVVDLDAEDPEALAELGTPVPRLLLACECRDQKGRGSRRHRPGGPTLSNGPRTPPARRQALGKRLAPRYHQLPTGAVPGRGAGWPVRARRSLFRTDRSAREASSEAKKAALGRGHPAPHRAPR